MSISALRVLPAATGRAAPSLIWTSAALIAQVVAIFLLAPIYLAEGAAWARAIHFWTIGAIAIPFAVSTLRGSHCADSEMNGNII